MSTNTPSHRRVVDYSSEEADVTEDYSFDEAFNTLSSLIETSLANSFGFACAQDLESDAKTKHLGARLRTVLAVSREEEEQRSACEECIKDLWRILKEESCGWDKPFYRECFVLCSLRLSLLKIKEEKQGNNERCLQEAMERLDTALIMGCPGEVARPFVRCVEKLMCRKEKTSSAASNIKKQKVSRASKSSLVVETTLSSSPLVPKIINPLEKMKEDATWQEFKEMYFNKDMPVQLPSDESMPCIKKWQDVAYFKERFGKRLIPLEVGKYDDVENWKEEIVPMETFIDEHLAPDILKKEDNNFVSYLAQHQLFEQIPQLALDFEIPKWCNAGHFERCNIWLGTSGTITPCHFDSYDNIFGQIVGYKFVRMYLESDSKYLYKSGGNWETTRSWTDALNDDEDGNAKKDTKKKFRNAQGNISHVDVESPDLEKYPDFAKATPMDVILGPGDFIYIPSRTWHYVRSLTVSCSLNFLF